MKNELKTAAQRLWHCLLCLMLVGSTLLACGGAEDDSDLAEDEVDFGVLEQAMLVDLPKFGISTAASHIACSATGPSGQVCHIPRTKVFTYCLSDAGGAWVSPDIGNIDNAMTSVNAALNNQFTFAKVNVTQGTCTSAGSATATVKIRKGTCSGGSGSSNIEAYGCMTTSFVNSLTENLPGTWNSHAGGTITLDMVDIATKGGNAVCVLQHGVRHQAMNLAGLGYDSSQPDVLGALASSQSITPFAFNGFCVHSQASNREKCTANTFNNAATGSFGFRTTTCTN
jgi:hypothetical protein